MATCNECYHFENCEWDHLYAGDDDAWECCDFIRPIDAFFTKLKKQLKQENKVTVKELIEILEKMPQDLPVF